MIQSITLHLFSSEDPKERKKGKRNRQAKPNVFKFDSNHTLFSAKTIKFRENKIVKEKSNKKMGVHRAEKKMYKNLSKISRLRTLVKKQARKMKSLFLPITNHFIAQICTT